MGHIHLQSPQKHPQLDIHPSIICIPAPFRKFQPSYPHPRNRLATSPPHFTLQPMIVLVMPRQRINHRKGPVKRTIGVRESAATSADTGEILGACVGWTWLIGVVDGVMDAPWPVD